MKWTDINGRARWHGNTVQYNTYLLTPRGHALITCVHIVSINVALLLDRGGPPFWGKYDSPKKGDLISVWQELVSFLHINTLYLMRVSLIS
jgi:hypothetical protein